MKSKKGVGLSAMNVCPVIPKFRKVERAYQFAHKHRFFDIVKNDTNIKKLILTSSDYSYQYCKNIIKARWKEAEDIIISHSFFSYLYARFLIKGRWEEAESIIGDDSIASYCYSKWVIGGRLPEMMHNKMLIHAINNKNSYTTNYFSQLCG